MHVTGDRTEIVLEGIALKRATSCDTCKVKVDETKSRYTELAFLVDICLKELSRRKYRKVSCLQINK